MDASKEIDYLFNLSNLGWKLGLSKIKALLTEIGKPQEKYPTIHIAGTNGKGSTSAILASILKTAGYNTGLFTSPHLVSVCERIKYNNTDIDLDDFISYIKRLKPFIEKYKCTFFESMTAIAFVYFADRQVDVAVIEVGLGGRLDATNIIEPVLTIITDIEHDHTKQLGRSRQKIAMEKGGIIKKGTICLTNSRHKNVTNILSDICRGRRAEFIQVPKLSSIENIVLNENFSTFDFRVNGTVFPKLKLTLLGEHQIRNASLAISASHFLTQKNFKIRDEHIYRGLTDVHWPGRMQILHHSPGFVVDVAHNSDGTAKLVQAIQRHFDYQKLTVIIGISKNKNYHAMIKNLSAIADQFIIVKPETQRALEPEVLAKSALTYQIPTRIFNKVNDGIEFAFQNSYTNDLILGTGSHYTVGDIIKFYKKA